MPNSPQREAMLSPFFSQITKRIHSSITELSSMAWASSLFAGQSIIDPCLRNVLLPRGSCGFILPIGRQVGLGIAEDSEHIAAIVRGELGEFRTPIGAAQHIEQAAVDARSCVIRHGVEGLAVNHIAEWVLEEPLLQIKIP